MTKRILLIVVPVLGAIVLIAAGMAYSWMNDRQGAALSEQTVTPSRQAPTAVTKQALSPEEADDNLDAAFLELELTR